LIEEEGQVLSQVGLFDLSFGDIGLCKRGFITGAKGFYFYGLHEEPYGGKAYLNRSRGPQGKHGFITCITYAGYFYRIRSRPDPPEPEITVLIGLLYIDPVYFNSSSCNRIAGKGVGDPSPGLGGSSGVAGTGTGGMG
jgi:hypothetical protein